MQSRVHSASTRGLPMEAYENCQTALREWGIQRSLALTLALKRLCSIEIEMT